AKEEMLPLQDAAFRVASRNVVSQINLPDTKCSRWDGIAFNYDDYAARNGDLSAWRENSDYIFSNTGIGIFNDSFDTMVKIEDTVFQGKQLLKIIQSQVKRGQNIIPVGERMSVGEVLVAKDMLIMPSHLNLMASGGNALVSVYAKPKVAILSSGNELLSNHDIVEVGRTIESNSFSMAAKIKARGGEAFVYPILPDDQSAIKARIKEAVRSFDVVVLGGGSGKGQHDLLQESLADLGTLYFSEVEHGPGKRTCFAVVDNTPVFGLVGPPGGEELTFDFYVLPALDSCLNQKRQTRKVRAVLDSDLPPHFRVSFYFTLRVYEKEGHYHAEPLLNRNFDRAIADYNAYLFVTKTSEGYKKGDIVEVELRTFYETSLS
ncbi:MAG: molybdopterin molybdotransferase MoeA, partial [Eubacteriales bacterium]|nr:molybdopterin molybdotransferase MoeA [Eubacteriales bacterium]